MIWPSASPQTDNRCCASSSSHITKVSSSFQRKKSQRLTNLLFSFDESLTLLAHPLILVFIFFIRISSIRWHHNDVWLRACSHPCPSASTSHFPDVIKTGGQQRFRRTTLRIARYTASDWGREKLLCLTYYTVRPSKYDSAWKKDRDRHAR